MFFMVQFNEITKQKNCKRYCNQSKENVNTKKSHALINGRLYHDLIFFKCKLGSILFNSLTHVLLFLFLTFIEHEYVQCCCLDTNKHSEFFSLFSVTYFHSFFFKQFRNELYELLTNISFFLIFISLIIHVRDVNIYEL